MRRSKNKAAQFAWFGLLALFGLIVLSACAVEGSSPTETPPANGLPATGEPQPDPAAPTPDEMIIPQQLTPAREAVADSADVPLEQVTLEEYTAVEWPDSCLGAAGPDEMCLQVITPGFRAVFNTPQGEVVVHTNSNGQIFRIVDSQQP